MRILLVKPPFARFVGGDAYWTYPLGLMYVSAALKARGHDTLIYHDDVSNPAPLPPGSADIRPTLRAEAKDGWQEPLVEAIEDYAPEAVGVGYCTIDAAAAHEVAAIARDRGIRTVAGGVHASLLPKGETAFFDAVVVGEGDSDEGAEAFEGRDGIVKVPPQEKWGEPWPDREAVVGSERYPSYLRGFVQTQRGCPYNCGYCATPQVFGKRVRTRDPADVREEAHKLGVRAGRVIDDSFGVKRDHALRVCEEFARLRYAWNCDIALQNADAQMLTALAQAGCGQVNMGIESAVPRWQKLSGKRVADGAPEAALRVARARRLRAVFYFIIGWPGETEDELRTTLDYARSLKEAGAHLCISVATPYPKTRLWDLAYGNGDRKPPPWSEFIHQSSRMGFADCAGEAWEAIVAEANLLNREDGH